MILIHFSVTPIISSLNYGNSGFPLFLYPLFISLESCKFWRPFRGSWHCVSVIALQLRFVLFAAAEMAVTPTDEGLTKMVEVPNCTVVHAAICWCFLFLLL